MEWARLALKSHSPKAENLERIDKKAKITKENQVKNGLTQLNSLIILDQLLTALFLLIRIKIDKSISHSLNWIKVFTEWTVKM